MTIRASLDDGIARLVLAHPPVNILTRAVLGDLRAQLDEWATRPDVRVLLLTADGKHFSAGADVGEHLPPAHEQLIPEFVATVRSLAAFPVPTVAGVRGRCLGGGFELVQAIDLMVAGEGATFGQPEILLGVIPPAACALLPALVGRGAAAELVFTGEAIDAPRAARLGLVQRVVPDAEVDEAALLLAGLVARHSRAALVCAKRALATGGSDPALDAAERVYLAELMRSADAVEGLHAFLEKRTPAWSHR
ncbi:MAG: enoyl-CoA hydratase-related protein [Gemmatimonadota bacterium]|nr:enoyl-CoA hydratase-related protein [Gemmatimonadota bacterium]